MVAIDNSVCQYSQTCVPACASCNVSTTKHLNNVNFSVLGHTPFTRDKGQLINTDLTTYFRLNTTLKHKWHTCKSLLKMTGGTPEVCSDKSFTLLTFYIWYLTFYIWHLNIWTFEHLNIWTFEYLNIWKFEHLNTWTFEHLNIWTIEQLNNWIFE